MAKAKTKTETAVAAPARVAAREVAYVPFGENQPIKLTVGAAMGYLATPSKSGVLPDQDTAIKFLMLCRSRGLNPFTGDAFLIGYDTAQGTRFNLITAYQAILKRAVADPDYRGKKSGVIVREKSGAIVEREGELILPGETLVGGWCEAFVRERESSKATINFAAYDQGYSRWKIDPAGMIVKCACAKALREAFPNQLAGLYLAEEMPADDRAPAGGNGKPPVSVSDLTATLAAHEPLGGAPADPLAIERLEAVDAASGPAGEVPADDPAADLAAELAAEAEAEAAAGCVATAAGRLFDTHENGGQ